MLPNGWKRVPLHKIAEVRTGLAKGKQGLKEPVELPYLRVANVQDGHIDLREVKTIALGKADIDRYALLAGDVLMTEGGDFDKLGRGAVWNGEITPCLHQNHVFAVRPNVECLDSNFLAALSASQYGRNYFLGCAKRSTNLASINSSQLKTFPVLLPLLNEQKGISEVLVTWDAAITTTGNLLANSCRQKQALMQCLLSKGSKEWKQVRLAEISERVQRQSDGQKYPVLMISSGSSGFVRQDEKYSRFMAGKSLENYILLQQGEFAYNKGNSKLYEFGCVFPLEDVPSGLVPHVYVCFKMDARCDSGFYKYLFEADYLHDQLGALVNTGVRNNGLLNIRPADFMNVRVPLLPLAEQRAIASVLETASKEIECIKKDLEALKRQKRALMQQLLSGKRRVRLPDQDAVEA